MSIELKIKANSLAAEAIIIQRIERKLKKMRARRVEIARTEANISIMQDIPGTSETAYRRWGNEKLRSIQHHRRWDVRRSARRTHLARMFLKGMPYRRVEATTKSGNQLFEQDWTAIQKMAERYANYRKMGEATRATKVWSSVQQLAQEFERWKQGE